MKNLIIICAVLLLTFTKLHAQDSLKYSKQQVTDDITYLFKNAADIHPNLYHSITKAQLAKRTDSLIATLPDSLSTLMAYHAFANATAFINEGHTSLDVPPAYRKQMKTGTFVGIPLQVTGYNDKHFEGNLLLRKPALKGIKVTSINGQPAEKIFGQLIALRGGLTSFKRVLTLNSFRFNLTVIGINQPYSIEYLDARDAKHAIKVNGISESEYNTAIAKPVNSKPYTFTIKDNAYGYLDFKSMSDYDGFAKFCDSLFAVLSNQHIAKLVVDLRENGGGNSALGRYLLNYITDKPYRMAGAGERKVSQQFKDYLERNRKAYGNSFDNYLKMENGSFLKMGLDDPSKPDDKVNKFKGKVCFLIGSYTFSSANMLASTVKDYHLATLIGEPVGEPANDYGELCTIKLTQTGLFAFTSTTMWVRPNNDKTDNAAIAPDYLVKKSSMGGDNVLEFAMKWLGK